MKHRDFWIAVLISVVIPFLTFAGITGKEPVRQEKASVSVPTEKSELEEKLQIPVLFPDGQERQMSMEEYLVGVLLGELPASFPGEAKKAQAVVARTYALRAFITGGKHGGGQVCTDPGCCQCYRNPDDYLSEGGTEKAVAEAELAVEQTAGQVLEYDGELIEATYFSCSGGKTEDAVAVWGADVPYLQSTDSPGEEDAAHYEDTVTMETENFLMLLGLPADETPEIGSVTYTEGGGVETMEICGRTYSGPELREKLSLRSTAISIGCSGETTVITTHGFGHRVGMSQYGAKAMAEAGRTYDEILLHYYRDTDLTVWQIDNEPEIE